MMFYLIVFTAIVQLCHAINPGRSVNLSGLIVSTDVFIDIFEQRLRHHLHTDNETYGRPIYSRLDQSCIDSMWWQEKTGYVPWANTKLCDRPTQMWRFEGDYLKVGDENFYKQHIDNNIFSGGGCLDCNKAEKNCLLVVYACWAKSINQQFFLRVHPSQFDFDKYFSVFFSIHSWLYPDNCITRTPGKDNWTVFTLQECDGRVEQSFYLQMDQYELAEMKQELTLVRDRLELANFDKLIDNSDLHITLERYNNGGNLIYSKNIQGFCLGTETSSHSEGEPAKVYYNTRLVPCKSNDFSQQWSLMHNRTRLQVSFKWHNFVELASEDFPCLEISGGKKNAYLKISSCDSKQKYQDFTIIERYREEFPLLDAGFQRVYFSIHYKQKPKNCATLHEVNSIFWLRMSDCPNYDKVNDDQLFFLKLKKLQI